MQPGISSPTITVIKIPSNNPNNTNNNSYNTNNNSTTTKRNSDNNNSSNAIFYIVSDLALYSFIVPLSMLLLTCKALYL